MTEPRNQRSRKGSKAARSESATAHVGPIGRSLTASAAGRDETMGTIPLAAVLYRRRLQRIRLPRKRPMKCLQRLIKLLPPTLYPATTPKSKNLVLERRSLQATRQATGRSQAALHYPVTASHAIATRRKVAAALRETKPIAQKFRKAYHHCKPVSQ